VTDLVQLSEHLEPLTKALNDLRDKRGLDFAMLLITDVVRGSSRLLTLIRPAAHPLRSALPSPAGWDPRCAGRCLEKEAAASGRT
jgi:hypothetical protein